MCIEPADDETGSCGKLSGNTIERGVDDLRVVVELPDRNLDDEAACRTVPLTTNPAHRR